MNSSWSRTFSICREECSSAHGHGGRSLEASELTTCFALKSGSKHDEGQTVSKRNSRALKLDVGMWSTLDDDLLEKIIGKLPFKSVFQASSLSKPWRLRLCSHSFQSEVQKSSSSWKSYTPLFVNSKQDVVGYETNSERLHRLPTHSYIQEDLVQDWSLRAGAGSLLCWTCPESSTHVHAYDVYVTNPLTKSWKRLPSRPEMQFPENVHVVGEGSKSYKVILSTVKTLPDAVCIRVQTFDSANNSWAVDNHNIGPNIHAAKCYGSSFIDGVLYLLMLQRRPGYLLICFDLKERAWREFPIVFGKDDNPHGRMRFLYGILAAPVAVCGSNVMLVVYCRGKGRAHTLSVLRLDLQHGLAVEVSSAPNEMLIGAIVSRCSAAAYGDCIYIGCGRSPSVLFILYNMRTQEWHRVISGIDSLLSVSGSCETEWMLSSVTYQPGLNPFLQV